MWVTFKIQFTFYIYPLQGKNNYAVTEQFFLLVQPCSKNIQLKLGNQNAADSVKRLT